MANIYLKHKNSEQNIKMKITEITTKFVEPHFCKKIMRSSKNVWEKLRESSVYVHVWGVWVPATQNLPSTTP